MSVARNRLLLPLLGSLLGCEGGFGAYPELTRTAPAPVVIPANQSIGREVRGCVVAGADMIDRYSGGTVDVAASAQSNSTGTVILTLPLVEMAEPEGDDNVARAPVVPGRTTFFEEEHAFVEYPVVVDGFDHEERCTEWKAVEFEWAEVEGSEPVEVQWEVSFTVSNEGDEGFELAIDFRGGD